MEAGGPNNVISDDVLYYATHSPTTEPGAHSHLLDFLPQDLASIAEITQGLIYHFLAGPRIYGWTPPTERVQEINTRSLNNILTKILEKDPRPLTDVRVFEQRLVACCRDYSLLACAILRQQGKPARLRYGFASYFLKDYWIDHVIVEVWEGNRWRKFDPQLSSEVDWGFDITDLPENVFLTGGAAWVLCNAEDGPNPDFFGLGPGKEFEEVRGWWFIRSRLQLDVASLNKIELLCWDQIDGLNEKNTEDRTILDEMATLSIDPESSGVRSKCNADSSARWTPTSVFCFHPKTGPGFVVQL
jgi:hypothetical protein